ncbi:two-component system activity regulator YycH [uncultured Limosilactobacillus sp.]|uniref:two-component system activity regulator YycH n=1 Tax=uncultured Limosilactobacillus sp. TaxID=2837629 RepID=UPI0025F83916|nr:two-component system activity regulator YycH [uncultured Limosilactobacillus sp.]
MLAKLKDNWLAIILTIVVIVSLILSGIVWVNPYRSDHRFFGDTASNSERQVTTQSMRDIYLPTQVIKTNNDQGQHLLYGQPQNTVLTARQSIEKWQLHRLTRVESGRQNNYLNYLRLNNSVMLSYPSSVPMTIFNDSFNQNVNYNSLGMINHIVIPLNETNQINRIYLLSDHNYRVFRVKVTNANVKSIRQSLTGGASISVDHKIYNGRPMVTYPHGAKLPNFGYQISKINPDSVSQTLMNSSSRKSTVTSQRENSHIIYQAGTSRRLVYDPTKGSLDYENYIGRADHFNYQQIFGHIYNQLAGTSVPLDSLRYDFYNSKSESITYRSFVEGFPIFNGDGYGTVQIQNNHDGAERYHFSIYSLQVPIAVKKRKTTLPSSAVVFNNLRSVNKLKEVTGIRIGYQWDTNQNSRTVTLTPTYYIRYRNTWENYQNLVNN